MRNYSLIGLLGLLIVLQSCTKKNGNKVNLNNLDDIEFFPSYQLDSLEFSSDYNSEPELRGPVKGIVEASGIDKSIVNPNKVWVHNDGGNGEFLFLLDGSTAEILVTYELKNALNLDWEDIATGRDYQNGKSYIYIGDIGDNSGLRNFYTIYRLEEPVYDPLDKGDTIALFSAIEAFNYQYPNGKYNSETVVIDPLNGDIIVASYTADSSFVFKMEIVNTSVSLLKMGTLPFGKITGGDISEDRQKITLRTFRELMVWELENGETLKSAFSKTPLKLPYKGEPQGEAICWYNEGYYTLSEKVGDSTPGLYYYSKK